MKINFRASCGAKKILGTGGPGSGPLPPPLIHLSCVANAVGPAQKRLALTGAGGTCGEPAAMQDKRWNLIRFAAVHAAVNAIPSTAQIALWSTGHEAVCSHVRVMSTRTEFGSNARVVLSHTAKFGAFKIDAESISDATSFFRKSCELCYLLENLRQTLLSRTKLSELSLNLKQKKEKFIHLRGTGLFDCLLFVRQDTHFMDAPKLNACQTFQWDLCTITQI